MDSKINYLASCQLIHSIAGWLHISSYKLDAEWPCQHTPLTRDVIGTVTKLVFLSPVCHVIIIAYSRTAGVLNVLSTKAF